MLPVIVPENSRPMTAASTNGLPESFQVAIASMNDCNAQARNSTAQA
jgi:hypothetical protein